MFFISIFNVLLNLIVFNVNKMLFVFYILVLWYLIGLYCFLIYVVLFFDCVLFEEYFFDIVDLGFIFGEISEVGSKVFFYRIGNFC